MNIAPAAAGPVGPVLVPLVHTQFIIALIPDFVTCSFNVHVGWGSLLLLLCDILLSISVAVTFIGGDANAITLSRDPISREDRSDAIADNRVSVALGTQFDPATTGGPDQLMVAAAILASFRNLEAQSIVWVKDGVVIAENGIVVPPMVDPMTADPRYTLVATAADQGGTGLWRTVLTISGFQASDAGVYQVIFTDAVASNSEVLTTTPVRLDTGEHVHIAAVVL